jgi:hypothetical protein
MLVMPFGLAFFVMAAKSPGAFNTTIGLAVFSK